MLKPEQVTGVIVTRGDCDLEPCLATWPEFRETIIWDNSVERDVACFGRWLASSKARAGVVFHQDDDTIIPAETIAALLQGWNDEEADVYEPARGEIITGPGDFMVCNMNDGWVVDDSDPDYSYFDMGLQAAGCLAERDVWEDAVMEYLSRYPEDRFFHEWSDFVVGILTPHRKVDLPYECRDLVRADNRLANIPGNRARRKAMMRRVRRIRDEREGT